MFYVTINAFRESFSIPKDNYEFNLETIKKIASEKGIRTEGDFIFLYHGTSVKNAKNIFKTNKLKIGTWLSEEFEISKKYGQMASNNSQVIYLKLYMGSLSYNNYFTTMEDLFSTYIGYTPKNYERKTI